VIQITIWIQGSFSRFTSTGRRALAEVCTVPVLLVFFYVEVRHYVNTKYDYKTYTYKNTHYNKIWSQKWHFIQCLVNKVTKKTQVAEIIVYKWTNAQTKGSTREWCHSLRKNKYVVRTLLHMGPHAQATKVTRYKVDSEESTPLYCTFHVINIKY